MVHLHQERVQPSTGGIQFMPANIYFLGPLHQSDTPSTVRRQKERLSLRACCGGGEGFSGPLEVGGLLPLLSIGEGCD